MGLMPRFTVLTSEQRLAGGGFAAEEFAEHARFDGERWELGRGGRRLQADKRDKITS